MACQFKRHTLKVPLSYVSAEPFPGHFGIVGLPGGETLLGMFFKRRKNHGILDVAVKEVAPGDLVLAAARTVPFKHAMVVPPFVGADVVKRSDLGNPKSFIEVEDASQTQAHPNVLPSGSPRG